jgi:hypothetical protein
MYGNPNDMNHGHYYCPFSSFVLFGMIISSLCLESQSIEFRSRPTTPTVTSATRLVFACNRLNNFHLSISCYTVIGRRGSRDFSRRGGGSALVKFFFLSTTQRGNKKETQLLPDISKSYFVGDGWVFTSHYFN